MRRLVLAVPVLLLVTACSGGDGDGDGPSLEDRRAAYVESAEQACTEANEEVEALARPTTVEAVPEFTDTVLGVLERTVEDVTALEPPEEDRAELTEKVLEPLQGDLERAQEYATSVRAAAEANDGPALLALVSEVPETSADLTFMRDYGLVECAEAADTSD